MRLLHNIFNNRLCVLCTLLMFSVSSLRGDCASISPLAHGMTLGQVGFYYRIEKLVEKVYKHIQNKNLAKLIDCAMDIKMEVEGAMGKYIDINYCLDYVYKELNKSGTQISKEEFKECKKLIKKKDKKMYTKSLYISDCMANGMNPILAKVGTSEESGKGAESGGSDVLYFTVTTALCGVFLMILPEAFAVYSVGKTLFELGIFAAGMYLATTREEQKKSAQGAPK